MKFIQITREKKLIAAGLLVVCSLLPLSSKESSENAAKASNDVAATAQKPLNLPATESIIRVTDGYDKHLNRKRITAGDRTALKLDAIKNDYFAKRPNRDFSRGKVVYNGANGRMETVLIIADDHATWEFLLSYNPGGDYVDCVQIGDIMNYAGDRGEAHIKGNKVTYKTTWSEGEDSGESLFVYEITPDLHFYKQTQKQTDKKNNSMGPIIAIAILALLIGHMVYVVFFSKKFLNRTFTPEYFQQLRRNNGQSEFASEEEDELANNSLDEAFLSFPYLKGENQLRQPRSKKQLKEAVTWVNQVILNVKPTNPDTIEYLNTLIKIINTNSYRIYTSSLLVIIFGILIGIIAGTHTVLGGVIWGMLTIAYFLSGYCPVFLATKRSKQFFGGVDGEDIEKLEIKCMISDSKTIHPYKDVLINEYSTKGSSNAMAGFLWKLFFSFLKTTLMVFIVIFNYLRNYILFI